MAFIEISELDETLNIDNDSVFPLVYQGATKKITFATLKSVMQYFNAVSFNSSTGQFTFGRSNNQNVLLNTDFNNLIKDVSVDNSGKLIFTREDGTTKEIDVSISDGTITAEKLSQELQTKINSIDDKYTKPNTGIPKADLATDIQTSLGKADTSLQSTDIISEVSSSSTNSKAVGAKLFYDTVGDIETLLYNINRGSGVE